MNALRRVARSGLLALALLGACSQRRCGSTGSDVSRGPDVVVSVVPDRARCNAEIARGAVATVPGLGALDAIVPTCGDDGTLAVYAMRGHTLSRLVRSRDPGATFHLPDPVATGADRLGPIADNGSGGPLAWRSPTVLLDEGVSDEWWVAWIDDVIDGGARVHRGSAVMPAGLEALGIIVPIARRDTAVEVLATVARPGANPQLVRATVPTGGDELLPFTNDPPSIGEGELKAWNAETHTALVFAMSEDGGSVLRALSIENQGAARSRGEISLTRSHVLVSPNGLAVEGGTLFAYSEFDVVQRGAGPCLALDESLCVAPGPVRMLRVDASGVHANDVADTGLIDTFAVEHDSTVLAFYVAAIGETRAQRAVRFDLLTRAVTPVQLAPSDEMPPLDHPSLVRCGNEVWLAAEVVVEPGDAGRVRETAVMVVPVDCVVRADPRR